MSDLSDFPKNSQLEQEYEVSLTMADRMLLVDALRVAGVMVAVLTRGAMPSARDMLVALRLNLHAQDVVTLIDKLTMDVTILTGKSSSTHARELLENDE